MRALRRLSFGLLLCTTTSALADDLAKSAAESLFQDGRRLMKEGKFAEACPKLAESQRLDPGVGTLLYLGDCLEREGKLASAWATFREAQASASAAKQADRARTAGDRADALQPKLVRLTIRVAPGVNAAELAVTLDGKSLAASILGTGIALDPGSHVVAATAPGKKAWESTVVLDTTSKEVIIPALAAGAAPAASTAPPPTASAAPPPPATTGAPPPKPEPKEEPSSRKTIGLVVGGVGAVSLLAGGFFGLRAMSKWSSSKDDCQGDKCTAAGLDKIDSAKSAATLSNVFFGLGIVGVGVGATLWATGDGKKEKASLQLGPGSVSMRGAF